EEMRNAAVKLYQLDFNKTSVAYPFYNLELSKTTNNLDDILPESYRHIVYSGALGEKQMPEKLYELFNYASERLKNVQFHFFSRGHWFEKLRSSNTNNLIFFHDLVPAGNLAELYSKSAIQIIPQKEGTAAGSLPSKLPNLLVSGCKVLVITDENSEIQKLFNKYKLNTVVTLWNYEEICKKMASILSNNDPNEDQIELAKELFKIDTIVNEILA
ncbi:MAG: hypothetical protein KDC69_08070, partial [Flavobacteriaceae bacterium]|nr:hypothetical protein [Flavobacteriaceae bacterium]